MFTCETAGIVVCQLFLDEPERRTPFDLYRCLWTALRRHLCLQTSAVTHTLLSFMHSYAKALKKELKRRGVGGCVGGLGPQEQGVLRDGMTWKQVPDFKMKEKRKKWRTQHLEDKSWFTGIQIFFWFFTHEDENKRSVIQFGAPFTCECEWLTLLMSRWLPAWYELPEQYECMCVKCFEWSSWLEKTYLNAVY